MQRIKRIYKTLFEHCSRQTNVCTHHPKGSVMMDVHTYGPHSTPSVMAHVLLEHDVGNDMYVDKTKGERCTAVHLVINRSDHTFVDQFGHTKEGRDTN